MCVSDERSQASAQTGLAAAEARAEAEAEAEALLAGGSSAGGRGDGGRIGERSSNALLVEGGTPEEMLVIELDMSSVVLVALESESEPRIAATAAAEPKKCREQICGECLHIGPTITNRKIVRICP